MCGWGMMRQENQQQRRAAAAGGRGGTIVTATACSIFFCVAGRRLLLAASSTPARATAAAAPTTRTRHPPRRCRCAILLLGLRTGRDISSCIDHPPLRASCAKSGERSKEHNTEEPWEAPSDAANEPGADHSSRLSLPRRVSMCRSSSFQSTSGNASLLSVPQRMRSISLSAAGPSGRSFGASRLLVTSDQGLWTWKPS